MCKYRSQHRQKISRPENYIVEFRPAYFFVKSPETDLKDYFETSAHYFTGFYFLSSASLAACTALIIPSAILAGTSS